MGEPESRETLGSSGHPRGLALITGASAGIGRELARVFAAEGFALALVARSADALEMLASELRSEHGSTVQVLPFDLRRPGAADEIRQRLDALGLGVDVLVNNAGVMEVGAFASTAPELLEGIVDLNNRVLVAMTRTFLPGMLARGHGRILNVGSTAAFQPLPSMATYAASKAFVLSFSEALSQEVAGRGVRVTALCPGLTVTGMVERARGQNEQVALLPEFLMSSAADVARAGFEACMAGRVIEVPGLGNRLLSQLTRIPPRWLLREISGRIGRRFL